MLPYLGPVKLITQLGAVWSPTKGSLDVVFEGPVSSEVHVADPRPSSRPPLHRLKDAVENVAGNSGNNLGRESPGGVTGGMD